MFGEGNTPVVGTVLKMSAAEKMSAIRRSAAVKKSTPRTRNSTDGELRTQAKGFKRRLDFQSRVDILVSSSSDESRPVESSLELVLSSSDEWSPVKAEQTYQQSEEVPFLSSASTSPFLLTPPKYTNNKVILPAVSEQTAPVGWDASSRPIDPVIVDYSAIRPTLLQVESNSDNDAQPILQEQAHTQDDVHLVKEVKSRQLVILEQVSPPNSSTSKSGKKIIYSKEFRKRVVEHAIKTSTKQASKEFNVNYQTLYLWRRKDGPSHLEPEDGRSRQLGLVCTIPAGDRQTIPTQKSKRGRPRKACGQWSSNLEERAVMCQVFLKELPTQVIEDVYGRERTWMLRKSDSRAGESLPEKRKRTKSGFPQAYSTSQNQVVLTCGACKISFAKESSLDIHVIEYHVDVVNRIEVCDNCKLPGNPVQCFKQHNRTQLAILRRLQQGTEQGILLPLIFQAKCKECKIKLRSKICLQQHMKIQHGDNVKEGNECKKRRMVTDDDYEDFSLECDVYLGDGSVDSTPWASPDNSPILAPVQTDCSPSLANITSLQTGDSPSDADATPVENYDTPFENEATPSLLRSNNPLPQADICPIKSFDIPSRICALEKIPLEVYTLQKTEDSSPATTANNISPLQTANRSPWKNANSSPLQTANRTPLQTANRSPLQKVNSSPLQKANSSPLQTANRSPLQTANRSPLQKANSSPLQTANSSPMQKANSSPLQTANRSPWKNANSSQLQTANRSPWKKANNSPLQTANRSPLKKANSSPLQTANRSPWKKANSSPLQTANRSPWKKANSSPLQTNNNNPFHTTNNAQKK